MSGMRRVETARRLLLERTEIRADKDGQFRSIHEPPPRAMVPPKAAAIANWSQHLIGFRTDRCEVAFLFAPLVAIGTNRICEQQN